MFPLGLYDPVRRELRPDLRPRKAPVRPEAVFLLVEREIFVPPLEERHDDLREVPEEIQL